MTRTVTSDQITVAFRPVGAIIVDKTGIGVTCDHGMSATNLAPEDYGPQFDHVLRGWVQGHSERLGCHCADEALAVALPDEVLAPYALTPPLTQYQALQAVVTAAARVRHAVEQGNGIARYEAWRDMCAALDALGAKS